MRAARLDRLGKALSEIVRGVANATTYARYGTLVKRLVIALAAVLLATIGLVGVSATDPEVTQAADGSYVKKCGRGSIFLNEKASKTFALHNKERREHNLKPFCVHPMLHKAAHAHSKDMIQQDYFSHDTKGRNEDACERIHRYGYRWSVCGENIAYGSGSYGEPNNIMSGWMHSIGHRRNIFDKRFREIGIGAYTGNYQGHDGVTMYTVDFGTRGS